MLGQFRHRPRLTASTFLALLAILMLSKTPAMAAKRAFIVAIDKYHNVSELEAPVADGQAVKAKLEQHGFKVTLVKDATRDEFRARWTQFKNEVTREDDVVFYFAGHGIQVDSLNYLLPASVPGLNAGREAIIAASINFHEIVEELQVRAKRSIFVLDACREDPFEAAAKARAVLGPSKGLASLEPIYDTFVMFSAGANQQASDKLRADSTHSAYVEHLLPLLGKAELSLVEIAKKVQTEVFTATARLFKEGAQKPAYFDGILGDYYLARHGNAAPPAPSAPSASSSKSPATASSSSSPVASVASDGVIRLGGFATWDADCQSRPAPRITVTSPPKHGRIILRFEQFAIAGKHFGVGCDKRLGRGLAVYYVVEEADRASTAVDTLKVSVRHWSVAPATVVEEAFEVDLATRYSKRITANR